MKNIKPEERVCYNCKYLAWMIGIGQGLRCANHKKRKGKSHYELIPNSRHTCEFFEFKEENKPE